MFNLSRLWAPPPVKYIVTVSHRPGLRVRASEWVGVNHWASFYYRVLKVPLAHIYVEDIGSGQGRQALSAILTESSAHELESCTR